VPHSRTPCTSHLCTHTVAISSDPAAAGVSSRGEHSNSRSSSTHDNDADDANEAHCNGEDADMADTGGCSARQLISAVLKQCAVAGVALKLAARPPHSFDLRYGHLSTSAAVILHTINLALYEGVRMSSACVSSSSPMCICIR
jgi:hypothetical protein